MEKTEVDIANEVIDGKWGIGKDRETRIRKAGYDYNAVQGMVNQIVKTGKPIKQFVIDTSEYCGVMMIVR